MNKNGSLWNNAICSNMDGTRDYGTKWSGSETKTETIRHHLYLKYGTNEPIYKAETDSQIQRTNLWLQRGRGEERTGSLGLADVNCYV